MSPPKLKLRNSKKQEIAFSRLGVMWRAKPHARIGEFWSGKVFDNDQNLLGSLQGMTVLSAQGERLGEIRQRVEADDMLYKLDLLVDGRFVGQVFGDEMMAAAGLILFRQELLDSASDQES